MLITSTRVSNECIGYRHILPISENEFLGFLDIETMGLNRRKDPIILVGLMILGPTGGTLHQYFAQSPQEEKEMLLSLIQQIMPEIPLFTYNGRSFDIPYINQRLEHHGIPHRIPIGCCVDMLHWAKTAVPHSPRHNLKTIENHLGIHREDTLSGADCVLQYRKYLDSQDPQLATDICRHNYEDILHLAPLLKLYPMLPADSYLRNLPFFLPINSDYFWIERPAMKNDFLSIRGSCPHKVAKRLVNYVGSASIQLIDGNLETTLPVVTFSHPEPESLYIDSDRIPGFMPTTFNDLPYNDKLGILVRSGQRYVPDTLASVIRSLLQL